MASRYPTRNELRGVFGCPKPGQLDALADELDEDDEQGAPRGRQRPARKPRMKAQRPKKWKVDVSGVAPQQTWEEIKETCFARALGRCERCGLPFTQALRVDPHHRKLQSQGGRDELSNLAALCSDCHRWCHENPAAAVMAGWIVPSWAVPARRGLTLYDGRMVLLDDQGGYAFEGRPLGMPACSTFWLFCRTIWVVLSCFTWLSSTI